MTSHHQTNLKHLSGWLQERRWFGDKALDIQAADTVFRASDPAQADDVSVEVVRLEFATGQTADYLLLRGERDADIDGVELGGFRDWLMSGFAEARVLQGQGGRLRWNALPVDGSPWTDVPADSRVFRGEQSNSSIVYGDRMILKVFRKLREGVNPEVEIGEFLTTHTDFRAFPRLLGVIDLEVDGNQTTVAALQEFVPSVGDAWTWITERVADPSIRPATVKASRVLGMRTAEMHAAFASGRTDHFVPEVASGSYAEKVRAEALAELRDTVDQLERRGVGGAGALGGALQAALDALLELEGTMITRIHGDYHLGQVLRTENEDFAILDFEGEPTRSLAERRAKASPLRDVAGMLRSFDYAAETARRESGGETADIDSWYEAARSEFLAGYDSVARGNSVLMRGWEEGAREAALAAFEIHKALYEVRYELSNRPDWLEIPLNALRRIAAASSG